MRDLVEKLALTIMIYVLRLFSYKTTELHKKINI